MQLKHVVIGLLVIGLAIIGSLAGKLVEPLDSEQMMMTQDPIDGDLHFHNTAGMKVQRLGSLEKYDKSSRAYFSADPDLGGHEDQSQSIRFNDKASAMLSYSFQYFLPQDESHMKMLFSDYRTPDRIFHEVIKSSAQKAVYITGPLMSSVESAAERRPELRSLLEDQIQNGPYKTKAREVKMPDPITGEEVTLTVMEIIEDPTAPGGFARLEESTLNKYGIRIENLSIDKIGYADAVNAQIEAQREAFMKVQTAKADAKAAEQRTLTVEQEGLASAAQAKWEQEVIKAREVTKAEQEKAVAETQAAKKLEVAKFDRMAAAEEKQANILRGEGEAERKRLVLEADGALAQKLATYAEVQRYWADAAARYQGNWVPNIVMGAGASTDDPNNRDMASAGFGIQDFINIVGMKTLNDVSVDMTMSKGTSTQAP